MVDPQLDELQRKVLGIDFDPLDVPPGRFLTGGRAWQMCRQGEEDPGKFGIFDMHGQWFVAGNLVRDFLALNKLELLPWDPWGLMYGQEAPSDEHLAALDRLAQLSLGVDGDFGEMRRLYLTEPRLSTPPDGWEAWGTGTAGNIHLSLHIHCRGWGHASGLGSLARPRDRGSGA